VCQNEQKRFDTLSSCFFLLTLPHLPLIHYGGLSQRKEKRKKKEERRRKKEEGRKEGRKKKEYVRKKEK
jgi:hypothetical protein